MEAFLRTQKHSSTFHEFSKTEISLIREKLLSWYDVNKRPDLPWRASHGIASKVVDIVPGDYPVDAQRAYEVWMSEIMLQQTQVKTVLSYYKNWMQHWPTIFDLSQASLSEVNQVWAGLGYYSRARRVHEAAVMLVKEQKGVLPRTAAELAAKVPGVGRYTAGAIASIAYGERAEVVDGNVVRVLSRLRSIGADPKSKLAVALHWKLAKDLLDPVRPGDFNQALMEFGATLCTPQKPACDTCPVQARCNAFATQTTAAQLQDTSIQDKRKRKRKAGSEDLEDIASLCAVCGEPADTLADHSVTRYPRKVIKKAARPEDTAVCIVDRILPKSGQREYLLVQRPANGLLGGLWEFPSVILGRDEENDKADTTCEVRRRVMDAYLKVLLDAPKQVKVSSLRDCGSVPHLFSHIKHTYWVEHVTINHDEELVAGPTNVQKPLCKWLSAEALAKEAVSKGMKKAFTQIHSETSQPKRRKRA